jgi:hypothetical protein
MAITIRNKTLEAEIKAIGTRLNKGPTDVLKLLVAEHAAAEAAREEAEQAARLGRRKEALARLMAEARLLVTDEDRRIMQQNMDDMYDENGLPR